MLTGKAFDRAEAAIGSLKSVAAIRPDFLQPPVVPEHFLKRHRQVICPIRHQKQTIGALVIACTGNCQCDGKGLEIVQFIFRQTERVLHRAVQQEEEIRNLQARIESSSEFTGIVGRDRKMKQVYQLIEDIAPSDATVLIQGESGTGKELVANAIHVLSTRAEKPFMVINCSAFPTTLLESELFGHVKGAFTGALRDRDGRFAQADGGTVFLDEIGEISPSAQIKLLRVLQTQKFEPVGGNHSVSVDVRILAASNRQLIDEVRQGRFREDLFYRLNVIPVILPPLRERRNDIPLLAQHFLKKFSIEQEKAVTDFSSGAMRVLLEYPWPGNVRELENSIEHAVVLAKSTHIEIADLPAEIQKNREQKPAGPPAARRKKMLVENEKKLLEEVLYECRWNKKEAAIRLGISRSTLYEKIKRYQISKPTFH
jgi:two-component system response regulator HydG